MPPRRSGRLASPSGTPAKAEKRRSEPAKPAEPAKRQRIEPQPQPSAQKAAKKTTINFCVHVVGGIGDPVPVDEVCVDEEGREDALECGHTAADDALLRTEEHKKRLPGACTLSRT